MTEQGGVGDSDSAEAHVRLGARELVLLQLLARGYTPHQIAALRGEEETSVLGDLHRALARLQVATVKDAITIARTRGLIL